MTAVLSRPRFIGVITVIISGWIGLNLLTTVLGGHPIDPQPFLGDRLPASLDTAVSEMRRWFELCARYGGLPIMVHAHAGGGATDAAYCDPESYRPLARDFPTVPLILCHMGGARRDFFDNALTLAHDHDNVFFNTSQTLPEHLPEAVLRIGAERIFFGVDWYPLDDKETKARSQHGNQMAIVQRTEMTDRQRELVLGEALAALLHLPN